MALVDAKQWQEHQAFTERAAELRERAVSILAQASGPGVFSLLATDEGKAALDRLAQTLLALRNVLDTWDGITKTAEALVEAAMAYRDARLAVDAALETVVAKKLGISADQPAA